MDFFSGTQCNKKMDEDHFWHILHCVGREITNSDHRLQTWDWEWQRMTIQTSFYKLNNTKITNSTVMSLHQYWNRITKIKWFFSKYKKKITIFLHSEAVLTLTRHTKSGLIRFQFTVRDDLYVVWQTCRAGICTMPLDAWQISSWACLMNTNTTWWSRHILMCHCKVMTTITVCSNTRVKSVIFV